MHVRGGAINQEPARISQTALPTGQSKPNRLLSTTDPGRLFLAPFTVDT
jgi:hypothetical protein